MAAWASDAQGLGDHRPDEEGATHLHAPGSVRGVLVWFDEEDGVGVLRLAHVASRIDWAMARELLAAAHEGGAQILLANETLGAELLRPAAWGERAKQALRHDLLVIRRILAAQGGPVWLPASGWAVSVTEQDLRGEPAIVEARLASRVARYAAAEEARVIHIQHATPPRRLAVWPLVPTRIPEVDEVVIEVEQGFGTVPLALLSELLGDGLERVGFEPTVFYAPALEADDPRRLLLAGAARPLG